MYYANVENKEIDNQLTIDENGVPNFYLYNYKGGGFLIVSAEYGEMPILANDMGSVFPAKGEQINAGLGMWLLETNGRIKAIREGKIKPSEGAIDIWNELQKDTYKTDFRRVTIDDIRRNVGKAVSRDTRELPRTYNCNSTAWSASTQVGPLTTTKWNQGCGYNFLVPENPFGDCEHAPAGCVAVSMAQIVRFHSFPASSTIDYSTLPDELPRTNVSSSVAKMIAHFGGMVQTSYNTSNSTGGSGANTANVESAL